MRNTTLRLLTFGLLCACAGIARSAEQVTLRLSWGHGLGEAQPYALHVAPTEVTVAHSQPLGLEPGEGPQRGVWRGQAGGGDIDGMELNLGFKDRPVELIENLNVIWKDLIDQSDPATARRLKQDPAYRRDPRRLCVSLDAESSMGFAVSIDQLLGARRLWIPSLGVYVDAGENPTPLAEHLKTIEPLRGQRILDRVRQEPEASHEQYTKLWQDLGSPAYRHPSQPAPGHIVCLGWDSSVPKFGVDRFAGVWNDYGTSDWFRLRFDLSGAPGASDGAGAWRDQRLTDGFPVVVTRFEHDGVCCEVEQFAYPLHGRPPERRGDIAMVLLSRVTVTEKEGRPRKFDLMLQHERKLPQAANLELVADESGAFLIERVSGTSLLLVSGTASPAALRGVDHVGDGARRARIGVAVVLPARGVQRFVVKLPSPAVPASRRQALAALDFAGARRETLEFWGDFEARGAVFRVPEEAVNHLYRANLWHALRLPRRHGGTGPTVKIDLPYSNFAYDQRGSPWPVNQAVYVDYMIYGLRGFHDVAAEELAAMFRNNQAADGRVGGYANWMVYTPSMLYSVAQDYLLSQDREAFQRLLPPSLRAMDWCLDQLAEARSRPGPAAGLIFGPLNDLTGDGHWAFNQAYMFAGLEMFGRALRQANHPRADECLAAAAELRRAINRSFQRATVESPLVELRDGTWTPYVPCEVTRPGRRFDQWYPTDVDTGAVHLVRLRALPADGRLADCLLDDHEDNLFLGGWGMANEPVYNQQATAYLLRDEPKAAIRAFYSMMACAFSHTLFEPVEHRWTWGQYFGPPSTDGAWAELYRNMLVRETDEGGLLLFSATPRRWLEDGKRIEILRAPTYYGRLSARLESHASAGKLLAEVELAGRNRPKSLRVRFRHPAAAPIRAVVINGRPSAAFDPASESVQIDNPDLDRYRIEARY